MKAKFVFLSLFLLNIVFAKISTIENIPNPYSVGNGNISNPDYILSIEETDSINSLINKIEKETTVQIKVAIVYEIDRSDYHLFGTELFNKWKIGTKDKDNGLLILVIVGKHRVETITGYGMEGVLPDLVCKKIQMDYMLPFFKNEKYGSGILAGIQQTYSILQDPSKQEEVFSDTKPVELFQSGSPTPFSVFFLLFSCSVGLIISLFVYKEPEKKSIITIKSIIGSLLGFSIIHFLLQVITHSMYFFQLKPFIVGIYIYLSFVLVVYRILKNRKLRNSNNDALIHYNEIVTNHSKWMVLFFVFPLFSIIYGVWYIFYLYKSKIRFAPRVGKISKKPLRRLSEKDDNAYLEKGQITEEEIRSIDYDVWVGEDEGDTEILQYNYSFKGYSNCPSCKYSTKFLHSDIQLVPATYSSSGTGERHYLCKNCEYSFTERYLIPKKERSSSGGGSGGGSSGGGSSGGGGSGSSW